MPTHFPAEGGQPDILVAVVSTTSTSDPQLSKLVAPAIVSAVVTAALGAGASIVFPLITQFIPIILGVGVGILVTTLWHRFSLPLRRGDQPLRLSGYASVALFALTAVLWVRLQTMSGELPPAYVGHWSGTLSSAGSPQLVVTIDLRDGKVGEIVGVESAGGQTSPLMLDHVDGRYITTETVNTHMRIYFQPDSRQGELILTDDEGRRTELTKAL